MNISEDSVRRHDVSGHRWGRRVCLEVPVRLALGGRRMGHGLLRNVSISGALIETALELPVFTNLVVVLPTSSEAVPSSTELAACVVRRQEAAFAVEWRDMACPPIINLIEKFSAGDSPRVCATTRHSTRGDRIAHLHRRS